VYVNILRENLNINVVNAITLSLRATYESVTILLYKQEIAEPVPSEARNL